ncbi:MAG: site-specific integrase, partial [Verrucomicrobiota bacterium]
MTNQIDGQTAVANGNRKLTTISIDGKWKSFHAHAGLMQYIPSGVFFARAKVNGIVKRASLETDVFTTAKDRLRAKLKELQKPQAEPSTFAAGRVQFEAETRNKHELSELSRVYRLRCVDRILRSWPGLDNKRVNDITKADCEAWAKRYADKYAPQFFNNSLNVLREILSLAGQKRDDNPAYKIKRRGIPRKQLDLPSAEQFNQILAEIETAGAIDEKDRADFCRFLAFSGCRLNEAKQALWQDVDWQRNELTIHCLKRRATSDEVRSRVIPIVPAMRQFLTRLHGERHPKPEDTICQVFVCKKPLVRACKRVGVAPLTHHSLRHLFATFCIEAGIDIPTVSRWLGHSDGGALAMRVYGHLRREHSQLMAQRVTFGALP